MKSDYYWLAAALPLLALVVATTAVVLWLTHQGKNSLSERLPGSDESAQAEDAGGSNALMAATAFSPVVKDKGNMVKSLKFW